MIEVVILIAVAFAISASFVWCCDPEDSHMTDAIPEQRGPADQEKSQ
jgi:hypothetical protein